jgi:hypothetical protein
VGRELHVGVDAEKVVVSPYPIKARSGTARRERTGTLIEILPRTPSGRGREERVTFAARLALPLIFASAVLGASGANWWLVFGASLALVAAVPERAAFAGALDASRRVRRTWPALDGMIDPELADLSLTRALGELADVLGRRQELRRLRSDLAGVRDADIPGDSPAKLAADAARERADVAWREAGDTANRILGSIDTAARAGESFIRERQVAATARHAERTLARVAGVPALAESGPDLAGRTEAVIAAYRDLAT